ncbi:MAG: gas vesicle protein [Candidatus Aenigmarchaeota archaeon]|nr:gas vesicle protein [Candidatus Aenigmarchaeota archaeon]
MKKSTSREIIQEKKSPVEIGKLGLSALKDLVNKPVEQIVSVVKDDQGWKAVIETLERKAVPDTQDLLGRYELEFSPGGKLLNYRQIMVRRRSDLIDERGK